MNKQMLSIFPIFPLVKAQHIWQISLGLAKVWPDNTQPSPVTLGKALRANPLRVKLNKAVKYELVFVSKCGA